MRTPDPKEPAYADNLISEFGNDMNGTVKLAKKGITPKKLPPKKQKNNKRNQPSLGMKVATFKRCKAKIQKRQLAQKDGHDLYDPLNPPPAPA
eukprot:5318320-Alexandrium_andersonii.AAC.1